MILMILIITIISLLALTIYFISIKNYSGSPGHSPPGHDSPGHDSPGHDSPGHSPPGHDSPGHGSHPQEPSDSCKFTFDETINGDLSVCWAEVDENTILSEAEFYKPLSGFSYEKDSIQNSKYIGTFRRVDTDTAWSISKNKDGSFNLIEDNIHVHNLHFLKDKNVYVSDPSLFLNTSSPKKYAIVAIFLTNCPFNLKSKELTA
tara:strand:- start:116 stop:727 length:612 start_codon:yes stop_codon:yes gene_type:complete